MKLELKRFIDANDNYHLQCYVDDVFECSYTYDKTTLPIIVALNPSPNGTILGKNEWYTSPFSTYDVKRVVETGETFVCHKTTWCGKAAEYTLN